MMVEEVGSKLFQISDSHDIHDDFYGDEMFPIFW